MFATNFLKLTTAAFVLSGFALAQNPQPPPGTPPSPAAAPSRGAEIPRPPTEMVRPIFVSGQVVMEDGGAPPSPAVIERVCNAGTPRREGHTDARGHFSIQLGSNRGMLPDASSSGFANELDDMAGAGLRSPNTEGGRTMTGAPPLMGCELRASLAGFVSSTINLHNRQPLDNPDVGTLVLYRMERVQGTNVSAADLKAPKEAKKLLAKVAKNSKTDSPAAIEADLRRAVEIYPQYTTAWLQLGLLMEVQSRFAEARDAYTKAIAADDRFVRPYVQLAGIASREQKWQETADLSRRALELNPFAFPNAYLMNAMANYHLKNFDAAEASARKVRLFDTEFRLPVAHLLLGTLLLQKRDYSGAAEGFRAFLKAAPGSPDAPAIRQQLQEIEKKLAESPNATTAAPAPHPQ